MLNNILPEITRFCRIISTVTGVDIEIVDAKLDRISGTGIYAETVGSNISQAGKIYSHALRTGTTVYIDNPREHGLCQTCPNRDDCRELLTLCTPITLGNKTLGVIGLICFTVEDRERVLDRKDVFVEFVQQIAGVISTAASNAQRSRKVKQMVDLLLQITDRNAHGILMLSKNGRISYVNEVARQEFGLEENCLGRPVSIRNTGNTVADMKEYELRVGDAEYHPFGRLIPLESEDDDFARVLLTDPVPRMTEMFSLFGGAAERTGGLTDIIGASRVMEKLKKRVRQIAHTSSTVLITGESGTGKEMFARAIHAESERKGKPFIAINCGAIPDSLLESELFGYVSGAFTGAKHSGRMGKFELADGGVLFLDEISSMSLYLQVKLLRALQERNFTRLGSNREISVDVRVIAATNDNLPTLIEQKMFRDDLYYRLNVIPLDLPPLRQRKEDLPCLAEFFLDHYCVRFGKPPIRLTPAMLAMLRAYPWPGNVREFENCIEYLVNMHDGGQLTPALLPAKIHDAYVASATGHAPGAGPGAFTPAPLPAPSPVRPLADLEMEAIENAVALYGDTTEGKKQAAEALGIGVATLYRKLQK
ncbi:MAG: sigma 54-interacting transcriptional regulator [Desulfovibrio sp.]|jgi:transcriptional regulator with PAS, ATPase and Fis domain|nr:sigma 54-interacting transcriptional regulator [Desulfovibrio sp.]